MSESPPEKGGHSALPDLGQKVGPLPAWGWGAIVVVAYLLWRHYAAGKTQTTGAGATQPADANGVPADALGGSGTATSGNGLNSGGFTDGSGAVINQAPTNQAWASSAIDALLASGKYTYADAVNAVDNYVLGNGSSATERGIINTAVGIVGKPPIPVPFVDVPTDTVAPVSDPAPVATPEPIAAPAPEPAPVSAPVATAPTAPPKASAAQIAAKNAAVAKAHVDYQTALAIKSPLTKQKYDAYWAAYNKPALEY